MTPIAELLRIIDMVIGADTWTNRIRYLEPKNVLELGTGRGASGVSIMTALPAGSTFTTINYDYPVGYRFGGHLDPWVDDKRLRMIVADTLDPLVLSLVPDGVDLLFIDSTHEAWHVAAELTLWQKKLADEAIVVVDDLNHNDMYRFWDSLNYDKAEYNVGCCQGVFRYAAAQPYRVEFPRGATAKERSLK